METLHPGLYLQEEVMGQPPLEGVSTATGAFVGVAPKGAVGGAVLVTNWNQYVNEFGAFVKDSYLAYAVRGFFENGGSRAYISRVVHYDAVTGKTSAPSTLDLNDVETVPGIAIKLRAKSDGVWGDNIKVAVKGTKVTQGDSFDLEVYLKDELVEIYENLTLEEAEARTKNSRFIKMDVIGDSRPKNIDVTSLAGGKDGLEGLGDSDYLGDEVNKNGLHAFDNAPINLVAMPGVTSSIGLNGLITYVHGRKDCFAIMDAPFDMGITEVRDYVLTTANLSTEFGAIYYPHIEVSDSIGVGKKPTKFIPPSGHIMGAFARTGNAVGVWRAPAGTDVKLLGTIGLRYKVSDAEQDMLNPVNINCIRAFDGVGICIWGTRTLSKGEYKYIPVRRTVIYIEQSINAGMLWTVFKPNDESLWGLITSTITSFLTLLWSQGGLKGKNSAEAFFVKCDEELNTPDVIDSGTTLVDIGICPQKPAEFIVFRLSLLR